jgi:hypothetical protein
MVSVAMNRRSACLRSRVIVPLHPPLVVIPTVFESFDNYWGPFLGGQAPAPSYLRSLNETRRTALREAVRARLPISEDGSIHLTARAWAVRGRA